MRSASPATLSSPSATPRERTPWLISVVALATLLVVSAVPAPTAATVRQREAPLEIGVPWLEPLGTLMQTLHGAIARSAPIRGRQAARAQGGEGQARQARRRGPFSMNLYREGDFVNQKTAYWCIPASTQTMMNIMDKGRPARSAALQARLYRIGDRLEEDGTIDDEEEPDRFRGMGISEWAGLLNRFDYGPYGVVGYKSRQNALRNAARMMRKTRKPVGLVVWRGAHAWVMSGFTATADPAVTRDFAVTSVWVHDPWYPRVSSFWGRSRSANARVSVEALAEDFRPYGRPGRRNPDRDGRFMLVMPGREPAPPED